MKKARILVLTLAFAAAGGAAYLAKGMIGKPKEVRIVKKEKIDTTKVLVARQRINLGDQITVKQLRWKDWPKNGVTRGYILHSGNPDALNKFRGAIARSSFLPDEPIQHSKILKAEEGGVMAAILNPGMRAISVKIKENTAAGGFILPNDRVDVIMSRVIKRGSHKRHLSNTILTNIRVLAIGQIIEQKDGQKSAKGKTATLELTLKQAEILTLSESMGDISLALRALSDKKKGNDKQF